MVRDGASKGSVRKGSITVKRLRDGGSARVNAFSGPEDKRVDKVSLRVILTGRIWFLILVWTQIAVQDQNLQSSRKN